MSTSNPSHQPLEAEQILAVANGDRLAFSDVYDRCANPVFALAMAMLRNKTEAEDLLQEVMVKVWTKASSYNAKNGSPLTWIMAMTRNGAIDRIRKGKRGPTIENSLMEEENLKSEQNDGLQSLQMNETRHLVRRSLLQLPSEQRQALELAYFSGLTHSEIAVNLNIPVGTIKARIRRGMQKLHGELQSIL